MKLKSDFITHKSGDENILISVGGAFSGLVRSNETAAFIIEQLKNDTTAENIVDALLAEYDVDRDRAAANVASVLEKLNDIGALDT